VNLPIKNNVKVKTPEKGTQVNVDTEGNRDTQAVSSSAAMIGTTKDGVSPSIMDDKWTINDELNVDIYAEALAHFLTENESREPLSISIQAPWGGGKTSLMRMIQYHLDRDEFALSRIVNSGSRLRLREFIKFLSHRNKQKEVTIPHIINSRNVPPRLTIWFNPWKYGNVQLLWAGLLDCIVRSIISRLDAGDRELLLLKLNLRTQDLYRIHEWVLDTIFFSSIRRIRRWLIAAGIVIGVIAGSYYFVLRFTEWLLGSSGGLELLAVAFALAGSLLYVYLKIMKIRSLMQNEPVEVTLDKYVEIPEGNNLNFDDVKIILSAIPDSYRPIIVFIDDLDRCSPDTVRQVIDGINSFFTENLPCIFVIAMDAEMVAAALEVAQSQIISKLPKYSSHSSVGWKFMDKFVQLPIMLPPFGEAAIKKYVKSVLGMTKVKDDTNTDKVRDKQQLVISSNNIFEKCSYTKDWIVDAAYDFSNNPRDIKRFVNSLRFYRFLLGQFQKNHCNQPLPDMDKIKRWTFLSLRWPTLVRWLYWSPGGTLLYELKSTGETDPLRARLKLLEKITCESSQLRDWETEIKKLMHIRDDSNENVSSLIDENLKLFFESENELPENERLSSSAGRGIY
jgi:hypothetical protein